MVKWQNSPPEGFCYRTRKGVYLLLHFPQADFTTSKKKSQGESEGSKQSSNYGTKYAAEVI